MRNQKLHETRDVLNIQSLKHLSLQIGIPEDKIIAIAKNIKRHYRVSEIVHEKPDGRIKKRKIYHPSPQLKEVLKAINTYLLRKIKLPMAVHGSRKYHSPLSNALIHVGKRYVMGFDIENFFPSIRPYSVFNMFIRLKCSPEISKYLTRLCTADNHVPQGYNTSPAIANLVLVPCIERLQSLAKKQKMNLGTFIDDICFSGNSNTGKYKKTIEKIINECGYQLKAEKTSTMTKRQKQTVTGIVVNVKANIDDKSYRDLKNVIHICRKYGPSAIIGKIKNKRNKLIDTPEKLKTHIIGRLSHVRQLNPEKADKLRTKFDEVVW